METSLDLVEYAERRTRLAGGSMIHDFSPFNLEMDTLGAKRAAQAEPLLNFATYDYLGLSRHRHVLTSAKQALDAHGAGVGASRIVGGDCSLHRGFERDIAEFLGLPEALALVSGYGANVSLVSHILTSADLLLVDDLAHNSIMTGSRLSSATTVCFNHNDIDHLSYLLGRYRARHKRVVILAEGLYSMDGDSPDLAALIALKRRHSAWLFLDEAHSVGVLGATGRGLAEQQGVDPTEIDFLVGTMSKALVSCGGFVCAQPSVIYWLRHTLPAFVYSVGAPPSVIASARAALDVIRTDPSHVARLRDMSNVAFARAHARGLRTGRACGRGIMPIYVSSPELALRASQGLLQKNIYLPPVLGQAVSNQNARLRMFISAGHSKETIERAIDAVAETLVELGELAPAASNVAPLVRRPKSMGLASSASA